jgi:DNA-directed RNA polymerase specialized sigma24 family protein
MSNDPLIAALESAFGRLNDGDEDAIDEILRLCHQRFLAMARNMLRGFPNVHSLYRTSDVLGETWPDILRALENMHFESPVVFIRVVGKNIRWTLLDLARRVAVVPGVYGRAEKPDSSNDPVEFAIWAEIHEWIDRLPDDERVLYDLLCYCGYTQPEAAKKLGVCEKTVQRGWRDAKLKFAAKFGDKVRYL